MIRLNEMRVLRSKAPRFLSDLDGALSDLKVAPGHRTAVTCLAFGEIFARACTMRPEEMKTSDFFRTTLLPAVQSLCDGIVEIITVDADMIIKATFAAYEYRCDQAYPGYGAVRPCLEDYVQRFELPLQEAIKTYPDLGGQFWIFEDLFRAENRLS